MISSHGRVAFVFIILVSFTLLLSLSSASAGDVSAMNVSNESNVSEPIVNMTYNPPIGWRAQSVDGYVYHANNTRYNFSVKQGSNWGDGTRYCVGSNCLVYQPSDMSYRNSVGSQDYLSNVLAVNVVVENQTATYPLAFPNTDVTYTLGESQVKELFVLQSLPRAPAGWLGSTENVSLDFGGYIKYGSLNLSVGGELMPSEFTTSSRIDFVDENGTTVFYLPAPVAYDSDGDSVGLEYEVDDRGTQIWFYVKTPYSWLNSSNTTYPVYIDPTVSVPGTAWDTRAANPTGLNVTTQDAASGGFAWGSDGTKLYEIGWSGDKVYEYNVSTPWDVSTAVYYQSIDSESGVPTDIAWSSDGTKMYQIEYTLNRIYQVELSTPWDISTAGSSKYIASRDAGSTSIFWSSDGTKMYESGISSDRLYQSDVSTPWDISTATLSKSIPTRGGDTQGIAWGDNGTKFYETAGGITYQSNVSTAWDIGTATYSHSISDGGTGIRWNPSGTRMYLLGGGGIYQYQVPVSDEPVIDYTNLTAVNVSVNDSWPVEGDVISYTTTITPSNATNVTYFVAFGDGTNSTDANGTHTYTTPGSYNLSVNATDSQNNTFTSTALINVESSTTVNLVNLTPSLDFNLFSPYVINANVTNGSTLNNVTVTYVSNSTFESETCFNYYVNGTCDEQLYEDKNMTFNGTNSLWEYTVYPDSIYPEIYYVPSAIAYSVTPANYSVSANDYHLFNFTNPYEFTNRTSFFIELNVAPKSTSNSVPLDVYIIDNGVNASFFEGDWMSDARAVLVASANPDADLVESISRDTPVHHTHSDTSSHQLIRLSTDENKTIGGVNVSGQFLVAIIADNPSDARGWWLRYQEACTTDRWLVADSTPTFQTPTSVASGCPDVHVHVVRDGETNADYLNATVTANYDGGSATNNTVFYYSELLNLPPNPSSFITPASDGYVSRLLNSTYKVQWNEATDPNNDPITYTVFLLNSNLSQNATLVSDTSSLSYDWVIPSSLVDGEYYFVLEACDDAGECTNNSEPVTFDSTAPLLFGYELPAASQDDTGAFTIIITDENMASVTVSFKDPNGNALGPFAMTNSSSTYSYSYRFTVVGDYTDVTFTSTDLAGNTLVTDGGSFFVSNPPTTPSTPTGGGSGGGGTTGSTDDEPTPTVNSDAEGIAVLDAEPKELRLSFYQKSGRLYLENLGEADETFTIKVLNTKLEDRVSFLGERIGLVKVPGRASGSRNAVWVTYDVYDVNLSDGRYVVTFQVSNSKGQVVAVETVDIVKQTTLVDETAELLSREAVPPITGMGIAIPAISYLGVIALLASVGIAGLLIKGVPRVRAQRSKKKDEDPFDEQ